MVFNNVYVIPLCIKVLLPYVLFMFLYVGSYHFIECFENRITGVLQLIAYCPLVCCAYRLIELFVNILVVGESTSWLL